MAIGGILTRECHRKWTIALTVKILPPGRRPSNQFTADLCLKSQVEACFAQCTPYIRQMQQIKEGVTESAKARESRQNIALSYLYPEKLTRTELLRPKTWSGIKVKDLIG